MLIRKDFCLPDCILGPTQDWSLQPFFTNLSTVDRFSPFLQSHLTLNSHRIVTMTAWYSRNTSTKSLSFCMATFSANLRPSYLNHVQLLHKQTNTGTESLWLQNPTDIQGHDFAHFLALWHQHWLAKVTCAWSWRLCRINPTVHPFGTNIHSLLEHTPYGCRLLCECAVTKQH